MTATINQTSIAVTINPGGVTQTILGVPGQPGKDGADGASATIFTHVQSVAAMVWTVDHNLGAWPDVIVFDDAGNEVVGTVQNPTLNRSTLSFSQPVSGTARFS